MKFVKYKKDLKGFIYFNYINKMKSVGERIYFLLFILIK